MSQRAIRLMRGFYVIVTLTCAVDPFSSATLPLAVSRGRAQLISSPNHSAAQKWIIQSQHRAELDRPITSPRGSGPSHHSAARKLTVQSQFIEPLSRPIKSRPATEYVVAFGFVTSSVQRLAQIISLPIENSAALSFKRASGPSKGILTIHFAVIYRSALSFLGQRGIFSVSVVFPIAKDDTYEISFMRVN